MAEREKGRIVLGAGNIQSDSAQIKGLLAKIGVKPMSIDIRWDNNTGAAMLAFEYEGKKYERHSTLQPDSTRNLFAIKMNIAHKVLDHNRKVEPFADSMLKYQQALPSPKEGEAPPAQPTERATLADYSTLGIIEASSIEQINGARRSRLKFYHPDRFQDDSVQRGLAEQETLKINSAYDRIKATRGF